MNNYIKEIKALLIFAVFFIFIIGFPFFLGYFKIENYFYSFLILYIVLCLILTILTQFINNIYFRKIVKFFYFPISIILTFEPFFIPFLYLILHVFCYLIMVYYIPLFVLKILIMFDVIGVNNNSTLTYLSITISVSLSVLFNFQVRNLVYLLSLLRGLKNLES